MSEKEAFGRYDSIRTFFGFRRASKFVFRKLDTKNSVGFTLIELLVVIGIIGILAVAIMTLVNPVAQFQKANDARRKSDLAQIQKVLEQYYNDRGRYPFASDYTWYDNCQPGPAIPYRIAANSPIDGCISWGTTWTAYNTNIPKDPVSGNNYVYSVSDDGQTYYLYAHLERGYRDPQNCCPAGSQVDGCSCVHAGGDQNDASGDVGYVEACGTNGYWADYLPSNKCNYGVSSSNTKP